MGLPARDESEGYDRTHLDLPKAQTELIAAVAAEGRSTVHGIDLIHPPFWWWAWLHGLGAAGHQLEEVYKIGLLAVIVGTYVLGCVGLVGTLFGRFICGWACSARKVRRWKCARSWRAAGASR